MQHCTPPTFVRPIRALLLSAATLIPLAGLSAEERRAPARAPVAPAEAPASSELARFAGLGTLDEVVLFDEPGDGALWARGRTWKMSFGDAGATWYPRFGPRAPRNFPFDLTPASVMADGAELAFERRAAPARHGERVELDRGPFVEAYELAPDSIEQLFVFPRPVGTGDLVLRIPATDEFEVVATPEGLEFRSEHGTVRYGRGTAIDAHGRRADIEPVFEDGAIVLRLGAGFLAEAAWPLVIDPVVTNFYVEGLSPDAFAADVAWEPTEQGWLVVHEQVYSAADSDVYAKFLNHLGATVATDTIDFTAVSWHAPRCANLAFAQQFLVVCEVETGLTRAIKGRTVEPSGTSLLMGFQFEISDASPGNKIEPDVGGDPFLGEPSYYCVVWQQEVAANDSRIAWRLVNLASQVQLGPNYMPTAPLAPDSTPSVAKSNNTSEWLIAWARQDPVTFGDIYAAHVRFDGLLVDGPFGVTSGGLGRDALPSASTALRGTRRALVAFQRRSSAAARPDVWATAFDGTTWLSTTNVTALEAAGTQSYDQIEPSVDCDGRHFLLAYAESNGVGAALHTAHAADLFLAGSTLVVAQAHQQLGAAGIGDRRPQVGAQHSVAPPTTHYCAVWDAEATSTPHDVMGATFDTLVGGTWTPSCPGDGTGTPCPCGNSGAPGNGCGSSVHPAGARLECTSGPISVSNDGVVLEAGLVPNNVLCLFFQGDAIEPGTPFGDGIRCAGGTLTRVGTVTANGAIASAPEWGGQPLSVRGGVPAEGGVRVYQVWYRNAASFCTSATFNATSGVVLNWSR
jgi:hypothetical protein